MSQDIIENKQVGTDSEVKQVTFFSQKPRCPKCQSVEGEIVKIQTTIFEEKIEDGQTEENCFLLQDIAIDCKCGTSYEAKYLSLPLASMDVKIVDHAKKEEEEEC